MTGMYDRICHEYEAFSPRSRDAAVAARDVFPGGDTRSSAHFAPYPLFIERAEGARLHDTDGHTIARLHEQLYLAHPRPCPPGCGARGERADGTRQRLCGADRPARYSWPSTSVTVSRESSNCVSAVPAAKPLSWPFAVPAPRRDGTRS